jgi:hypothetical protein
MSCCTTYTWLERLTRYLVFGLESMMRKTGVVVVGRVYRLEVIDAWQSCGSGCLCVLTQSSGPTELRGAHPVWPTLCTPLWGSF